MLRSPLLALTTTTLTVLTANSALAETQDIAIQFQGMVGDSSFVCGFSYGGLGMTQSVVTPTDFRLYVSEVALIAVDGAIVPVQLTQDGKWQHENVALLDFENKADVCANGTTETNTRIVGTVPAGNYQGLQFSLGVPFALNHDDVTLAPSPLNLTSMWWNWRGGYKFLRVDLRVADASASESQHSDPSEQHHHNGHKPDEHHPHGKHNSQHQEHHNTNHGSHHANSGFLIHLGSTGCEVVGDSQQPTSCVNPNRATVTFPEFDPHHHVVIADLAALVAGNDLAANAADTPPGCMSGAGDGDCQPLFEQLGITGESSFFRVGQQGHAPSHQH